MEMAHAERRRLERDLHDGVQQHLVGLRIKLDMATETFPRGSGARARRARVRGRRPDGRRAPRAALATARGI